AVIAWRQCRQQYWPQAGDGGGWGRGIWEAHAIRDIVFVGQSQTSPYMSPSKYSEICSLLQEENSVAHRDVACPGKPLSSIYRKKCPRNEVEEQNFKDARRGSLAPIPDQQFEAAEPPKTVTWSSDYSKSPRKHCKSFSRVNRPLRKHNRSTILRFPPSSKRTTAELQSEEKEIANGLIESGKEKRMAVNLINSKDRAVATTKLFSAASRKTDSSDAIEERNRRGRPLSLCACGTLQTKQHIRSQLCLMTCKDMQV
ncbi:LOW QUALITY PROTEIN: N-lysine methyltransferase KMT5A, partial [Galemys pyrenaicus]